MRLREGFNKNKPEHQPIDAQGFSWIFSFSFLLFKKKLLGGFEFLEILKILDNLDILDIWIFKALNPQIPTFPNP